VAVDASCIGQPAGGRAVAAELVLAVSLIV
jgi:hypothetical protein